MFFRSALLSALITSTATVATPAQEVRDASATLRKRAVNEGEQPCHALNQGDYGTWNVEIRGPLQP